MDSQRDRDRTRRGDRPSRFSDAGRERSFDRREGGNKESKTIFISNIPFEYRWTDLKDLFKEKVGDVAFVEMYNDDDGKPRGCGTVEFTTPEAARKAMQIMQKYETHGRNLVLKEGFGKGNMKDRFSKDRGSDKNRGGGGGGHSTTLSQDRFNTYGLSMQFLESLNIDGPLLKRVFVANLNYNVDRAKLKEIFKMAGKVRNIELSTDKEGKSRGFAIVEYDHPVEAVQAISMFDKQTLYDRKMTVRMDRASGDKPTELKLPEGLMSMGLGLGPNGEPLRDVVRNLPNQQTAQNSALNNVSSGIASSLLGAVPAAQLSLNGLGAAAGLANNALGNNLSLQALGLTGLGALQNQLLQQGLTTNDLSTNLGLGAQGLGLTSANSLSNVGLGNSGLGGSGLGNSSLSALAGNISSNVYGTSGGQLGQSHGHSQSHSSYGGLAERRVNNMNLGNNVYSSNIKDDMGSNMDKLSDMVIINNLPPTVTWQLLREKFSECGEVKFAEMTGTDSAVVRFQREWDAERAIKMFDRTRIDGKTIDVRFF